MVEAMMEIGLKIKWKERESICGRMDENMRVSTEMTKNL